MYHCYMGELVLILAAAIFGGLFAYRFKMPLVVGYICGGIVLTILHPVSPDVITEFADVGIILLLFTVGLEIDVSAWARFGKFAIWGGAAQVLLSAFFLSIFLYIFDFSITESLFAGALLSFSSTALVTKILQDRSEDQSLYGKLTTGILVFQDMAAIPLIIIVSVLGDETFGLHIGVSMLLAIFKSVGVLLLIYILGVRGVPRLFSRLAKISREVLNLSVIGIIFIASYLFTQIGLSSSIAAFIAGVVIGQTREHYHIFSQIRPLRDLFAVLFFVFLGASLNMGAFMTHWPIILLLLGVLIVVKTTLVILIFMRFKFHSRTGFAVALALAHSGEFAFIILNQGVSFNLISPDNYQIILAVVIMSLGISPFLLYRHESMYLFVKKKIKIYLPPVYDYISHIIDRELPHIEVLPLKKHVIICGYGRMGGYIGRALLIAKIPYIGIDDNYYAVERARNQGINIIYGDATNMDILDYAQCEHALALISAVPKKQSQQTILLNARRLQPKIVIFTRVDNEMDRMRMRDLGASVVIQPEFEAAISIIKQILVAFDLPKDEIVSKIKRLKLEHGMS